MQIRREMRLQSVFIFEPPAAKHAGERGFFSAEAEVRVHGRFSRVDLAAHSARENGFLADIT